MGEFYPFPHLEHLDRYPEIFTLGRVIVTEKIHGTNARFGLVDGQFKVGGRNTELDDKNTNFGFSQWAMSGDFLNLEERLRIAAGNDNLIIYSEWYGPTPAHVWNTSALETNLLGVMGLLSLKGK